MADNVQLNSPTTSGAVIATDDIAGVQHQLVKLEFGEDGSATQVSNSNPLPSKDSEAIALLESLDGKISAQSYTSEIGVNSTTTPLASGATFTGVGELSNLPNVMVICKTDNTGTLFFDFSPDGTNWDSTFPTAGFQVKAGINEFHTAIKGARYFRVRLVNDTGAQTYLRLYTYYGSNFVPSNAPLNQIAGLDQDAIFTRGTIPQDEIRIGRREGVTGFTKFAYRDGLTAASGEQTVWTSAENTFIPMVVADTYTITYDGTGGGTTDGAGTTGALTLAITHVNANGDPETFIHTLGTDGSDITTQSGFGINRCAVASSGGADYNNSDITIAATISGNVQAHISANNSTTEQAIFVTSANHDAVAKWLFIKMNKLTGGGEVRALVKGYIYNRQVATRYLIFRAILDTRGEATINITDPIGFNLSPTDVIWFTVDTDTNSSEIDLRFSLNEYRRT